MPEEGARSRAEIRPVKQRVEDELLARSGVVGVDINEKVTNGQRTGELSIVVYVEEKKPEEQLSAEEVIPREIDGISTDVQQEHIELHPAFVAVTDIVPLVDATKYATIHGGISMGPCRSVHLEPPEVPTAGDYVFVGTLGALVRDRTTNAMMALTNFHVACVDNGWAVGDAMCQPSRVDGGTCPADTFATLTRATLSEHVDGAVVSVNAGKPTDSTIEELGRVAGSEAATVGLAVHKRGRTTGLTHGTVTSLDATVSIDYGDGLGVRTLRDQVRIVPTASSTVFSDRGDSGAVVVNDGNKVVGLLFGGSAAATYANPIQSVLDELDVNLWVKPVLVLTSPKLCGPIITKPVVCQLRTTTVTCHVVTKPVICQVVTTPAQCLIRTKACPPVTAACPPQTLACGPFEPGRPIPTQQAEAAGGLSELYGSPGATDEAFWLGYYTALDALSEAEQPEEG